MTRSYRTISDPALLTRNCFDDLDPNEFWNHGLQREPKIHKIHSYPAKFPAFITTKTLELSKQEGKSVKRIADIFCGCGTVAFEARRENIDFWGCDINPVATLIARTKSGSFSSRKLMEYFRHIEDGLQVAPTSIDLSEPALERLSYWYSKGQLEGLATILNAINGVVPKRSTYLSFFHCAFSNILKPTSRWLTKSIKPQVDPDKSPAIPWNAFCTQYENMVKAFEESTGDGEGRVEVHTGNFLKMPNLPKDIDVIITSPPYVTSYEYADLHQLSSLWLGYAEDYRTLRDGSIGSSQHALNFEKDTKRLNSIGGKTVFALYDQDKAMAKATANYFLDMQDVAVKCHGLLNSNGLALFVIGNTEYKGVRIDNAAHLAESLLLGGFSHVRVAKRKLTGKILTPYRDQRGKFTRSSGGRLVYGEEFVLIAEK